MCTRVFVIAPRTMRTTALLCALVRLDVLLVAEVFDATGRMHTIRQQIRNEVLKRHVQSQSQSKPKSQSDSGNVTTEIAHELFELFGKEDLKKAKSKSTPSSLTPQQLKRGLISLGVYIKRKDFQELVHCIDTHQTGEINSKQWEKFFTLSDDELDALHVDLNSDGNTVLMPGILHGLELMADVGYGVVGTATLGILAPMPQALAKALPGELTNRVAACACAHRPSYALVYSSLVSSTHV